MSNEHPRKPPQFKISRSLYYVTAAVVGMSIFVTFFLRNPYTQAVSGDYYEKHPYDETSVWTLVLVIVPAIGVAAAIYTWFRQRQQG
ncbi:hypothetical protein [Methylocystis bryophila]|uniref:Uncharacterized protein n=1 Tax=Methylocystis bryophila TaxID=655015 RepID=A0A1W6MRU9_9HYPH|nr:hypothetical protein [Methylocystis bryophila]ARN80292.1 hypothetical protein B1812_03445 [Methylocystis bryophila]BDV40263.1 hypothetical protein DSM21852_35160 [Methylocystis bryophila]